MSPIANRVRFGDLAKPPSDRPRMDGLVYPRVAQLKGESERQDSFDLCWKFDSLSAASMAGSVDVMRDDEQGLDSPSMATPKLTLSPRSPRLSFVPCISTCGEKASPRLAATQISNLLHGEKPSFLCTPPLLWSSRLSGDSSSLNSSSSHSYCSSSSSSSDSDY